MKLPLYLLALSSVLLHAQGGSLTPPPGTPAPTMKSLDQIEARTPLIEGAVGVTIDAETGGITISESGSYYLTKNLTVSSGNGITINANKVSLDLNGLTIESTANPPEGDGIDGAVTDVMINNGRITGSYDPVQLTGSGFENGVALGNSRGGPFQISNLSVSNCSDDGIFTVISSSAQAYSSINSCLVTKVGRNGITGDIVESCGVTIATNRGITATIVTNCKARSENNIAIFASQITNCIARSIFGDGINGGNVVNSHGHSGTKNGIEADNISQSVGISGSGHGIYATETVSYSQGKTTQNVAGKYDIFAKTAIGCTAEKTSITNKYLMP